MSCSLMKILNGMNPKTDTSASSAQKPALLSTTRSHLLSSQSLIHVTILIYGDDTSLLIGIH